MKLIKDLGTEPYGGRKQRFGLYECPVCKSWFKTMTYNVNKGKSTQCRSCASKRRKRYVKDDLQLVQAQEIQKVSAV